MSHVIVLPQDPSAAPPPGMTPSAIPDPSQDDAMGDLFSAGGNMGKYRFVCTNYNCCTHAIIPHFH